MKKFYIDVKTPLKLSDFDIILGQDTHIELSESARSNIIRCREYLDNVITSFKKPIYGINTGFGSLFNKHIAPDKLQQLQHNLVMSHSCGSGPEVPREIVSLMLFLKICSLSHGHSGVQLQTVQHLVEFFNKKALPKVYEMGSLGASGDLVPLAHLALPVIGLGEVHYQGKLYPAKELLTSLQLDPIRLQAKEGLALLNGTQFMSAYGIWCLVHAKKLFQWANHIGALSIDGFNASIEPFDELVHNIRPHEGQIKVASEVRKILKGSEIIDQPWPDVQDPYSFRCIPQVHGASWEVISFAKKMLITEINSSTDNPNCFPEENRIISAGNFHGQFLAFGLDFLAMGLSELGSISERRVFQLLFGSRNLPKHLINNPGINSGLMILQYAAAALVNQNKQLCTPVSVDSITSSNGQEDHVSMGANAATKLYRIVNNTYTILAIEIIVAIQAIHFRRPLKTSPCLEKLIDTFREKVAFIESDNRVLQQDIMKAEQFLRTVKLS